MLKLHGSTQITEKISVTRPPNNAGDAAHLEYGGTQEAVCSPALCSNRLSAHGRFSLMNGVKGTFSPSTFSHDSSIVTLIQPIVKKKMLWQKRNPFLPKQAITIRLRHSISYIFCRYRRVTRPSAASGGYSEVAVGAAVEKTEEKR